MKDQFQEHIDTGQAKQLKERALVHGKQQPLSLCASKWICASKEIKSPKETRPGHRNAFRVARTKDP